MALVDDMISNVDALSASDKTNKTAVHNAISTAIEAHITANVTLNGNYVGIIPPSTPSSLNGPHVFPVSASFVHANIPSAVTGSNPSTAQSAYNNAIQIEINKTAATGQNNPGTITLGGPVLISVSLSISISGTDRDTAYGQIADAINSALSSGSILPVSIAATGTDGSTGTVTFSTISVA